MARGSARSDWTAKRGGRGRNRLDVVDLAALPGDVTSVAFDQFVFDPRGLARGDGAGVARGAHPDGTVIAVGAQGWPEMPFDWTAIQSRRGPDVLGLAGDAMEPVGHDLFDERFAVDCDDVSLFRRTIRTSLREWLVAFDDEHGSLLVLFDGEADAGASAEPPRRRKTDTTVPESGPAGEPTVFLARVVTTDDDVVSTLQLTAELVAEIRASTQR